jgi:hypothetical protein
VKTELEKNFCAKRWLPTRNGGRIGVAKFAHLQALGLEVSHLKKHRFEPVRLQAEDRRHGVIILNGFHNEAVAFGNNYA